MVCAFYEKRKPTRRKITIRIPLGAISAFASCTIARSQHSLDSSLYGAVEKAAAPPSALPPQVPQGYSKSSLPVDTQLQQIQVDNEVRGTASTSVAKGPTSRFAVGVAITRPISRATPATSG